MIKQLLQLAAPIVDRCPHLCDLYGLAERFMISPLVGENLKRSIFGGGGFLPVRNKDITLAYRKIHSCQMMRS